MNTEKNQNLPEVEKFKSARWESNRVRLAPENISSQLLEIKERIAQLTCTWNPVEILTPSPESRETEKSKFIDAFRRNEIYHPKLDYSEAKAKKTEIGTAKPQLQRLLQEIRSLQPQNDQERLFRIALYYKVRDDLTTCDIVDGIIECDEAKLKTAYDHKYPGIDPTLLYFAETEFQRLIAEKEEREPNPEPLLNLYQQNLLKQTKFDASQVKEAFEWVLQRYDMLRSTDHQRGFQVEVTDQVSAIDVRDKSKKPMTIYIPVKKQTTGDNLLSLIAHEIEGHARQSINGMELFGIGGGPLKVDDETLYEGLAKRLDESFRERFFGEKSGTPQPWFALAVVKANGGATFAEIFKDQFDRRLHVAFHVPMHSSLSVEQLADKEKIEDALNKAWTTTYRIMRGHVDMDNPNSFAMCKDLGYLRGWLMDKQLREAGYGGINEMAIMQTGGLQLMARVEINDSDIPVPYQDLTKAFCFDILLPFLESTK